MLVRWWKLSALLGWSAAAAFALHAPARRGEPARGAPAGAPRAAVTAPWRGWPTAGGLFGSPGASGGLEALAEARTPAATCAALQRLGAPGSDEAGAAVPAVRRLLGEHPRRDVRECAVATLAALGGPAARDALDELRKDGNRVVRGAALTALAQSVEPGAFELVARQAKESDPERRHEALVALGRAGRAEMIPPLVDAIDEVGGAAREELIEALGAAGDGAVPPLVRLLEHPSEQVQATAAHALAQAGSAEAVRALARALFDHNGGRSGATRVATLLADLGDEGQRALQQATRSPSVDVRDAARRALLDTGSEVAREQLEGWLASSDRNDVDLALEYLGAHAGEAPLPARLTALARERPDFAARVANLLGRTGGDAAKAALRELAEGSGPARAYALQELGAVPGEAAWARARLMQTARDEGGRAADIAFEALVDDGSPEARDALIAAGRERGALAGRALTALGRFSDAEASRALAAAATGESLVARDLALSALAGRTDAAAQKAMLGALEAWRKPGATLPSVNVIADVCAGLAAQGVPEVERTLRGFADSPKELDWSALAGALAERERPLLLPADLAERLARDVERPYADSALRLLAERDAGRAHALVEGMAHSSDGQAREYAVRSAELLPDGERTRLLRGALLDPNEEVAMAAVRGLESGGGLDDQAALAGLLARGAAPPDTLAAAARALRDLGGEAARQHHDLIERYGGEEESGDDGGDAGVEAGRGEVERGEAPPGAADQGDDAEAVE